MNTQETALAAFSLQAIPMAALPDEQCAWCWYALHPGRVYPEAWSSSICSEHVTWALSRRKHRAQSVYQERGHE